MERTRRALARARAQGLLLGAGRGRAGGTLSAEAQRLLAEAGAALPAEREPRQAAVASNGHLGTR